MNRRCWVFGPDDRAIRGFIEEARDAAEYLLAGEDHDDGLVCLATAAAIETVLEAQHDDPDGV